VVLPNDMLFVELAEADDDWLSRNDMTGNKSELGLGYFGRLVVEKVKGRMDCIGGGGGGGSLLHGMVDFSGL
jgi:hypothetical protein